MARNTARDIWTGQDDTLLKRLRWPLRLTLAGLFAESSLRAFWPLVSVILVALATLMLGLHDVLPVQVVWTGAVLTVLAAVAALAWGARRMQLPTRGEAILRLDETLPGRPITALLDDQVIGTGDAASEALWQAHQARMAQRAARARAPQPDLQISSADPYALRHMALLAFAVALIFGSVWRIGTVAEAAQGGTVEFAGPAWEGWLEPPRYTGLPALYLNDMDGAGLTAPANSRVTLRFYGQAGALTLDETVSGRTGELPSAADPEQAFTITRSGHLAVEGRGGRSWEVSVTPDLPPKVAVTGAPEVEADGMMTLPFEASDDYGVTGGEVRITLDEAAVDRRHGLAVAPEPRESIVLDLPLPLSGSREEFDDKLVEDFSRHPWANLPVIYTFTARDGAEQSSTVSALNAELAARRFFDPLAAAVAEQRRDLLWSKANAGRVAQILRTVSHRPEGLFRSHTAYLRARVILRRLETYTAAGMTQEWQEEIADALWDLALELEEGDIGDALERLRRAQERLSQAMRDGASDQEIAELMQELRDATEDYLRQLQRQAQAGGRQGEPGEMPDGAMQMTQDDLQAMMDRIQELMEQGRMAEAEQALRELQELMENMRVAQGQPGQGGGEGQQAMEGLAETLREQQGLSDQAFRDLQEQFNPNARAGESQGNEGRDGGQGRGQSHQGGEGGMGQDGGSEQGQGGGGSQSPGGQQPDGQPGGDTAGSLADRQQALRDELRRQQQGLPLGGEEGRAARDALDRAGRAMDGAEDALRQDDLAGAIDKQAEAMEALREGMRELGEALAQQQGPANSQQGRADGGQTGQRDPLGRNRPDGDSGAIEGGALSEGSAYRRAWDLLEEIRRRSDESDRSEGERGYLRRLLDRF